MYKYKVIEGGLKKELNKYLKTRNLKKVSEYMQYILFLYAEI